MMWKGGCLLVEWMVDCGMVDDGMEIIVNGLWLLVDDVTGDIVILRWMVVDWWVIE